MYKHNNINTSKGRCSKNNINTQSVKSPPAQLPVQVDHLAPSPHQVGPRLVRVIHSPLPLSQPAGAAAAHDPVPEDDQGGQYGHGGVQHQHHAKHVFVGDYFEIRV